MQNKCTGKMFKYTFFGLNNKEVKRFFAMVHLLVESSIEYKFKNQIVSIINSLSCELRIFAKRQLWR